MKKLLLAVFAAELSLVAFPHTESEKLEVMRLTRTYAISRRRIARVRKARTM